MLERSARIKKKGMLTKNEQRVTRGGCMFSFLDKRRKLAHERLERRMSRFPLSDIDEVSRAVSRGDIVRMAVPVTARNSPIHSLRVMDSRKKRMPPSIVISGLEDSMTEAWIEVVFSSP